MLVVMLRGTESTCLRHKDITVRVRRLNAKDPGSQRNRKKANEKAVRKQRGYLKMSLVYCLL